MMHMLVPGMAMRHTKKEKQLFVAMVLRSRSATLKRD